MRRPGQPKNEDLNGFTRGQHAEGPHVCEEFVFQTPGRTQGVWGWNDTSALYCGECGKLATDHIVLAAPVFEPIRKPATPVLDARAAPILDQNQLQSARAYQVGRAAIGKTELQMLDDSVDPLSVGARGSTRNKNITNDQRDPLASATPVPAPPTPDALLAALAATAVTEPKVSDDVAALLAREKAYSDSFKEEVERMVRESIATERRKQLDQELDARRPAPPAVGGPAAQEQERYGTVQLLLEAVGLPQYVGAFESEAMDAETLYGVMEAQGRAALEEVLKELGVNSKGHRMKIANIVAP